jgi:ribonuclease P protein component
MAAAAASGLSKLWKTSMMAARRPDSASPDSNEVRPVPPERRVRFRFPRRLRIVHKTDFDRVMKQGTRVVDGTIMLWGLSNGRPDTRLGLAVGRRHGGAVQRNRIKRLLREAFRLSHADLPPGFDLACVPQTGADLRLPQLMESLRRLAARLAKLASRDQ